MRPSEFWRCTPQELAQQYKGFKERLRTRNYRAAAMTAHQVNVWLDEDDRVTPEHLLGRDADTEGDEVVDEQHQLQEVEKFEGFLRSVGALEEEDA